MLLDLSALPDTLLHTLISVAGVILSAVISGIVSLIVARRQTRAELEKLERTWDREDSASFEKEFHDMAESVFHFIHVPDEPSCRDYALRRTQLLRAQAPAKLVPHLNDLSDAVAREDRQRADALLQKLLDRKRTLS